MTAAMPKMKRAGSRVGTFVKTPSPQVIEILGLAGLDFAVVDAEHAPFDMTVLDLMMLASRASRLPLMTRIPHRCSAMALAALDMGAAGLLVPHVDSPSQAREVVAAARHRRGNRGFSGSPRFARYGTLAMSEALDAGESAYLMCQIESKEAVGTAAAIAAVDGVDGIFIGSADLALSMGYESTQEPNVIAAIEQTIRAGRTAGKTVGMFVSTTAERDKFAALGVEWFVIGSDQALLRLAAAALVFSAG
jgi:2-keto-3-deoxy-L-rhamnonate aldolase RhmA